MRFIEKRYKVDNSIFSCSGWTMYLTELPDQSEHLTRLHKIVVE